MIGLIRFTLAIIVVWVHIVSQNRQWGGNAVFLFYLMSGYFSTLGMQRIYKGKPLQFLANRALRILPTYWLVMAATVYWLTFGEVGPYFTDTINLPRISEWFLLTTSPYAVPVAGVLALFAFWWIAIAFGISATQKRATIWLVISVLSWLVFGVVPGGQNWKTVIGTAMPWALGSIFYWLGITVPRDGKGFRMLGEMAFSIYLTHYTVGAAISTALDLAPGRRLFAYTAIATMALSWLLVVAVERPISNFRKTLRRIPHG